MPVQFHFSDTSMTNNVKVIKSGVWTDQAQQDWCYSLIMHAPTDFAQKVCKKKTRTTTNTDKQTTLGSSRDRKWISRFPWIYLVGYGAKSSPAGQKPTGQKSKSVQKPTYYFFFKLSYFAVPTYYTWASLSSSLHVLPPEFASWSYSTPHKTAVIASLCQIQYHSRWQFVSLYQPHLHIRWQCLPLSVMLNIIQGGS